MESEVFFEPEPREWPALARRWREGDGSRASWRGRSLPEWRTLTRRELGLPVEKLVISTGHQAGFWHPGILAKLMAVDAVVDNLGRERASTLHLVVDQDDNDCAGIAVPFRESDGVLYAVRAPIVMLQDGAWTFHTPYGSHLERPTGETPALEPIDAARLVISDELVRKVGRPALDSIPASLRQIESLLRGHTNESSLAIQMAGAVSDALEAWLPRPLTLRASGLLGTTFGTAIIELIRDDPAACARAYNAVVAGGGGDVRPLAGQGSHWELPLWRIDDDRRRQPVFSSELASTDPARLRPRALLTTAIMRLVVCDLFIHGRGGFDYDKAMEKWIRGWLDLPVCPMTMATADLYLFPADEGPVFEFDIEEAEHAFRHVLHDPASGDDRNISNEKAAYLAAIDAAPRHSRARREVFLQYHGWLETARNTHKLQIEHHRDELARIRRLAANEEIVARRDWAFPLYPREVLDQLNRTIRARISPARARAAPAA
jgi:hypothetical protein